MLTFGDLLSCRFHDVKEGKRHYLSENLKKQALTMNGLGISKILKSMPSIQANVGSFCVHISIKNDP